MEVHRTKDVTSVFGGGHFTGRVWLDLLLEQGSEDGMRMYRVFFEPGARTNWHTHPGGQSLLVLAGRARVGTEETGAVEAAPGDVIYTPAGEWHWHGAGPDGYMVHLAFNPGGKTHWGDDRVVTNQQYAPTPENGRS